jgi:peptidoglycan/LPS O-acetylase OafA/YrhL
MAIGGVFGTVLYQKHSFLKFIFNKTFFYATLTTTCLLIVTGFKFSYLHYEIYSLLFGLIILNFAANETLAISLENRIFNYLGKISYGIYMYHSLCIVLTVAIAQYFGILKNWFIYPISISITIIVASISYNYFETFFLQFKNKFSKIKSGNTVGV